MNRTKLIFRSIEIVSIMSVLTSITIIVADLLKYRIDNGGQIAIALLVAGVAGLVISGLKLRRESILKDFFDLIYNAFS